MRFFVRNFFEDFLRPCPAFDGKTTIFHFAELLQKYKFGGNYEFGKIPKK